MLSREAKDSIINRYSEAFAKNPSLFVLEYKGLTVKEMQSLRSRLRGADAELSVVKNTLLRIASKGTNVEQIDGLFLGPTAIAVCNGEAPPVAKVFAQVKKDFPQLVVKGGVLDGNSVSPDDIDTISKLPSREVLLSQLLGLIASPMSNVVGVLKQTQAKLLYALNSLKESKEGANESNEGAEE